MMAKGSIIARDRDTLAAPADIQRILGTFDEAKLLDIMALRRRAAAYDTQLLWGRCGVCYASSLSGFRSCCPSVSRKRAASAPNTTR
jgi:hypothetical protein